MVFYPGCQYVVTKDELAGQSDLIAQKALEIKEKSFRCRRCNTHSLLRENLLPDGRYYCRECLGLGRITSSHYLATKPLNDPVKRKITFCFTGELTSAQQKISQSIIQNFLHKKDSLIYAVTGAGKTEMLFSLIHLCLTTGLNIAFCSPRVDVCCEIWPRLQAVFPEVNIGLRHYGAKPYQPTPLLVCTTHQLLYFKEAFHLIIVDEIDAFPYVYDETLHFAVANALHQTGCKVFLSATPSESEIRAAQQNESLFCLPARYHRRKLPVPQLVRLKNQNLPLSFGAKEKFLNLVNALLQKNHLLLFCATVSQVITMEKFLKHEFGETTVASVHATDQERHEKVISMRQNKFQIFCCSTVMERGVTFANVSVLVFAADHRVFTKATLLQIAGRADRKGNFSQSEVVFCFTQMTPELKKALSDIKALNRQAQAAGLIDEV